MLHSVAPKAKWAPPLPLGAVIASRNSTALVFFDRMKPLRDKLSVRRRQRGHKPRALNNHTLATTLFNRLNNSRCMDQYCGKTSPRTHPRIVCKQPTRKTDRVDSVSIHNADTTPARVAREIPQLRPHVINPPNALSARDGYDT